jgi:hypothetical protein
LEGPIAAGPSLVTGVDNVSGWEVARPPSAEAL